jgi:hypothetical protein
MKKRNFINVMGLALMLVGFLFVACQDEHHSESTTGKLRIQLTDAPFPTDLVAEANVTINKIEIRKANEDEGNPFITLSEEERSFNLLDLTNGVTAGLVDMEIEAGSYDLIRLHVAEASVVLSDGTTYDLKIPSGDQTGIKVYMEPSLVVAGGLSSDLLLDFDVSKSFVVQGNPNTPAGINGFIFKPVIKASNLSTAGTLAGTVTDSEGVIDGAQVAIIAADTVYTTSFTDETGAYKILGVDAGTYKVEFAKEGYVTSTVEGVEIVSANITTQDAELSVESAD